ncbi:uncharacterized protein LOC131660187 [Vicia villosa]|uniref:uncharacterized protein LOC131660187 n=1 Tax=Vicia villosa TaxID=3911 RepID=UPI00273C4DCA|nr:uncharacterized protein LOC131660187 [Vicia villosa]
MYARSVPLSAEAARRLEEDVKVKASTPEERDQELKEQGEELTVVRGGASLRHSQAPAEDETEEERALLTRADSIQYIRVLGGDSVVATEDTYNSTVAQLKLKNPGVELVTEGTVPYHRVEGDQIISLDFEEEPAT